jgi:hypothetical protein
MRQPLTLALVLVPVLGSVAMTACELPRAAAAIDAPAVTLDVDARRAAVERSLCSGLHDDADECRVLRALDASDGALSSPPALPELLPREIEVGSGPFARDRRAQHHVDQWLAGLDDMVPALRLPVGGVVDADLLSGAQLLDARLGVADDTLTFSLPAVHIAVAFDGAEHEIALVESSAGGTRDGAPIHFVRGGVQRLLEAATHDDGEVILRADPLVLDAGPDDTLVTPGGSAQLRVQLIVSGDVPLN